MAEIAVSFLLETLASFLQNEVQSLKNEFQLPQMVSEEIESIMDDLQIMKASLRAAELVEENNHELKEWVRQVREIAHDTEDVIEEFRLHRPDPNEHKICAFFCNFCGIIKKLEGHHQILDELQKIRARITKISTWHPNHHVNLSTSMQGSSSSTAGDALLLDRTYLVGIDEPKEQLIGWLAGGNPKRKVISIVGMGGSGKTTLAKQVYDDVRVKKHFKVRAFITISQPWRKDELPRSIVQQLFRPVPEGIDTMSYDQLREVIKSFLKNNRYLIVLDNVWHPNEWEALNNALANNNHKSRVITTTRNADVALQSCMEPEDQIFNMKPLSQKASEDLFYRRSFRGSPCSSSSLVEISERILKRCEGLPLAIVAISGVLVTKNQSTDEWETVYRSLGAEIDNDQKLKSLKEVLLLSFNDLPYRLKSCFLYLGIFPQNHLIETMRLKRLWIAEGLVEVKEGKKPEEVAEDYLNELLNRSLIQVAVKKSDGRVKTCRIHDLLREIVISKSRDQNFAVVAKEQDAPWPEKVRRLSIHNSLNNVQRNRNVSHLRSLFMFEVVDPLSSATLKDLLPGKLLKVLDLRGAMLEVFPGEIVNLLLLNYLSLRDTKIRSIPSSIGKLQNLETLDLKHTFVTELPIEILNLNKLRHLLVYRYEFKYYSRFHSKYGFKFLAGIGDLRCLQKLCFIEVDHRNPSLIAELGKLAQLRRLGILNLRREDGRILCTSIENLTNLRALSIVSSTKEEVIDLQHLSSPPPYLQRLYLYGRLEKIPEWIPSLQSLVIVHLKWSRLEYDPLESLQQLPNLLHLELLQVSQGDTLTFKAGGFQKLKILGIDKSDELRRIEVEKGAIPCIEKMSILRCKSLEKVPLGIEHLSMLKALEFFEMEELIHTLRPGVEGGDYWRVAGIPEVYFTYCRNGEWEVYSLESSGEMVPGEPRDIVQK
ncbi:hypothetical protein SLA2020_313540 [Shorea laevis]